MFDALEQVASPLECSIMARGTLQTIPGINVDDEPVPAFVHRLKDLPEALKLYNIARAIQRSLAGPAMASGVRSREAQPNHENHYDLQFVHPEVAERYADAKARPCPAYSTVRPSNSGLRITLLALNASRFAVASSSSRICRSAASAAVSATSCR